MISSIDYKITHKQWSDAVAKNVPSITKQQADVYFLTYRSLLGDIEGPPQQVKSPLDATVDVRCFAIYFAAQLFIHNAKFQTNEALSMLKQDAWGIREPSASPSMSSPRSKATKVNSFTASEMYSVILHFVKSNIKLFLRLVSSDIHNTEVSLSPTELNTMRILFKTSSGGPITNSTPFFSYGSSMKVHMNLIADWVVGAISGQENQDNVVYLSNLDRCVTIKEDLSGKDVRIQNCKDSYFYIYSSVRHLQVSNCVQTTVLVSAINKLVSIDKCEKTQITVAGEFIRIGSCIDCQINTYSVTAPPIVYGDTRSLTLGPHNSGYAELIPALKQAQIPFLLPGKQEKKEFVKEIEDNNRKFMRPIIISDQSQECYQVLAEREFLKSPIPPQLTDHPLFLCPQSYVDALSQRFDAFQDIQAAIKNAKLTSDQEKMLHVAIQGNFREWFVQTQHFKPLTEMINLMK